MVKVLNKIVNRIKIMFSKSPDLVVKVIDANFFNKIYVVYLETVTSSDKVNEYILKEFILKKNEVNKKNITSYVAGANVKKINNIDLCEFYLTNGFAIVIMGNCLFGVECRADINRSITEAKVESSINGPKDAFVENIQINIGLIKRRLKSSKLKIENLYLGRKSLTNISIMYFDDVADLEMVKKIIDKLNIVDIDGIVDSSTVGFLLTGENNSIYPTFMETERPDIVAKCLLEGKVAIVVDTTSSVIILPAFFIDFINPGIDNYNKSKNVNFIKILRFTAFLISMMAPALYIAVMNYNQETIPTSLLINFAIERGGVPFPTIIETLIMLLCVKF